MAPLHKREVRPLTLRVEQCMSSPVVTVHQDTDLVEAVKVMWEARVGALPVVDDDGRLVGIVTERDVIYAVAKSFLSRGAKVSDLMSRNVITVRRDDLMGKAIEALRQHNIRHLPVTDQEGRPIGMLSVRDVIDAIAELMRTFIPL